MDIFILIAMVIGTVAVGVSVTILIGIFVPAQIALTAQEHGRYAGSGNRTFWRYGKT
ncbi:hypothetical protein D3C72_1985690 [compost metagenome]